MSKGSLIGVVIFLAFVGVRIWFNDSIPDDPTTIAMKHAGVYGYVIGGGCGFIALCGVWIVIEQFRINRLRQHHEQLKAFKARLLAEQYQQAKRRQL